MFKKEYNIVIISMLITISVNLHPDAVRWTGAPVFVK